MRSHRVVAAVVSLGLGLLGAACSGPADDDAASSEAAHTGRAYTTANTPYLWAEQPFTDFRTVYEQLGEWNAPTLDDASELTKRLQAWLDRVDAIARPEVERQTGMPLQAPRPIAKIVHSNTKFNAWVSATLGCVSAPLNASASAPAPAGTTAYLDIDRVVNVSGVVCARPASWAPAGFPAFWNSTKPTCSVKGEGGGLVVEKPTCPIGEGAAPAAETAIWATSPFIQFSTDLLMHLDEPTVALVVAHELGHYYMAHGTTVGSAQYNYWYTLGERQQKRPTKAPNSAALEAAYKEVISPVPPGSLPFGKTYSPRLRSFLAFGVGPLLQQRSEPDFVCKEARDALGPWAWELQGATVSDGARAAFESFEAKLAACAPRLALGEASAKAISAGEVLFAAGLNRPGPAVKPTLRLGDTLASFLDRLDVQAKDLDKKTALLLQRARQNGLGLYTTEQAADDFAVEMATELGFTGPEVLGAWLDFMTAADRVSMQGMTPEEFEAAMERAGEMTAAKCKGLLDQDFMTTDASGRRVQATVALGQLDEPHHASCYRLFNMWREIRAHRYEAGPKQPALEPAWSALKEEAARLSAVAPPPPPAPAELPPAPAAAFRR